MEQMESLAYTHTGHILTQLRESIGKEAKRNKTKLQKKKRKKIHSTYIMCTT
jgi:hypothetical protein